MTAERDTDSIRHTLQGNERLPQLPLIPFLSLLSFLPPFTLLHLHRLAWQRLRPLSSLTLWLSPCSVAAGELR